MLWLSSYALADKVRPEVQVNFYTLAVNQESFHETKIAIRGWIGFFEYSDKWKILLFPSSESLSVFNEDETISIVIDSRDIREASEYLDRQFVTVYGRYRRAESVGKFGLIEDIQDIDITEVP